MLFSIRAFRGANELKRKGNRKRREEWNEKKVRLNGERASLQKCNLLNSKLAHTNLRVSSVLTCNVHLVFLPCVFCIENCGCCCKHLESIMRGMCIACSMHASAECTCLLYINTTHTIQLAIPISTTAMDDQLVCTFIFYISLRFIYLDRPMCFSLNGCYAIGAVAVASARENFLLLCFPSFHQVSTMKRWTETKRSKTQRSQSHIFVSWSE